MGARGRTPDTGSLFQQLILGYFPRRCLYPTFRVGLDDQSPFALCVVCPEHWIRGRRADRRFHQLERTTGDAAAGLFRNVPVYRPTLGNLAQSSNRQTNMGCAWLWPRRSWVRIPSLTPLNIDDTSPRACSSTDRALGFGPRGCRFESCQACHPFRPAKPRVASTIPALGRRYIIQDRQLRSSKCRYWRVSGKSVC